MKRTLALAFAFAIASSGVARAADTTDSAKIDALQKQVDAIKAQIDLLKAAQAAPKPAPAPATGRASGGTGTAAVPAPASTPLLALKPGNAVTLVVGGKEEVTLYGTLDVSADYATRGLSRQYILGGAPDAPVGNMGWQPFVSTNSSTFGVRGSHKLGARSAFVYQVATGINVTQESGLTESNSAQSASVSNGLGSQATFIGLQTPSGTLRFGKLAAPYASINARLDPFTGMLGSSTTIMGNTGGDNRVEFQTTMFHAVQYDSPVYHGLGFSFLTSPGQTRSYDNSIYPAGEPNCAGGNIAGSGATPPYCNDGSWGAVYSGAATLTHKKLYLAGAYELHKAVNRTSDLVPYDANDIADEDAQRVSGQWTFSPMTSIGASYESMHRYVPQYLNYQNERTRDGWWVTATQRLSSSDTFDFGWARANPTPGDPGQHNTGAFAGANPDNMANMLTADVKHRLDAHLMTYFNWAATMNHSQAHYDLGAGSHGIKQDCHDASVQTAVDVTSSPLTTYGTGPHCYAGGNLHAFSAGLRVSF